MRHHAMVLVSLVAAKTLCAFPHGTALGSEGSHCGIIKQNMSEEKTQYWARDSTREDLEQQFLLPAERVVFLF